MNDRLLQLERVVEIALTGGLTLASVLLLAGLGGHREAALRAGIIILMGTPVIRVLIITGGLLRQRDWAFAVASFFVLSVLATGAFLSLRPHP
jgi:hypothetical protein